MEGMEASGSQFPERTFSIQRAIADGDLVAVHSSVILKPGELELAVVHICRFEGGRIVEFWDVAHQVPKDNPNADGMF
jgi:predicted SnoaL-like aldol condensation-catalyzing enzyme